MNHLSLCVSAVNYFPFDFHRFEGKLRYYLDTRKFSKIFRSRFAKSRFFVAKHEAFVLIRYALVFMG